MSEHEAEKSQWKDSRGKAQKNGKGADAGKSIFGWENDAIGTDVGERLQ